MPKPIIFIPGFPGSELRDRNTGEIVFPPTPGTLLSGRRKREFFEAMLDIPGNLVAGPPIRSVLNLAKQAQSLYDILARFGYTIAGDGPSNNFAPIGWDWRLGVDAEPTMEAVKDAITGFDDKVIAIVHSTGALVFRAFLEKHPELVERIDQVLAFGAAWCGTLEALYAVHEGRSQTILGIPLMSADESANLIGHTQAAYDLLPPDPARNDMGNVQLVHGLDGNLAGANVDLSWIKENRRGYAEPLAQRANERLGARSRTFDLPLTNVTGWGAPTHPGAVLERNDVHFLPEEKDAGDGTMPLVSASWIQGPRVRTIVVPIGAFVADPIADRHAHMWDSLAVTDIFREVLKPETERKPFIAAAADSDDAIDLNSGSVTIRLTAQSNDGQPLPNCVATATIKNRKFPVPFLGDTRAVFRLNRPGLKANFGDFFRFEFDFVWDGGERRNVAVAFRAPRFGP
jgi:pimeloyl-ACP methyl ester carboxylesterase